MMLADNGDGYVPLSEQDDDAQAELWSTFKATYEKTYASLEEEQHRREIFLTMLGVVDARNRHLLSMGEDTHHGLSPFLDLTQTEFENQYLTVYPDEAFKSNTANAATGITESEKQFLTTPPNEAKSQSAVASTGISTLSMKDWTSICTTPVKDQRQCGSCWAFSATEQIESDIMLTYGLTSLSPLSTGQITDCTYSPPRDGCEGGSMTPAVDYVEKNGGITYDSVYPYSSSYNIGGPAQSCKTTSSTPYPYTVSRIKYYYGEAAMATRVLSNGPIGVYVDASTWNTIATGFTGVFSSCTSSVINHAVQVVGVDTSVGNWKIRNQWNTWWADGGYLLIPYGTNSCSIATYSAFSTEVGMTSKVPLYRYYSSNSNADSQL